MASNLLIVESPSKAKTLKKYLGKDFEILASYGHVRDLVPKTGAVDPEDNFRMKYELIERNAQHVDAIARAVKEAVKNPRAISMELVNAQQARRALDYLVGFNLSPLLWKKIRRGLSAGRVQSPALRLIVERELEIEKFKSQEYWSMHFDSTKDKVAFTAKLTHLQGEKLDQFAIGSAERDAEIRALLEKHANGVAQVREIEKKRKTRSPAAPFTTSTLQQEAVRKLGFSTDRTMKVAQSLYEGVAVGKAVTGLITYMRTDSVTLSKDAIAEMRGYITKNYGADFLPKAPNVYRASSKNAQEAH